MDRSRRGKLRRARTEIELVPRNGDTEVTTPVVAWSGNHATTQEGAEATRQTEAPTEPSQATLEF